MELHGSLNMIGYGLAAIGSAIGVGMIFAAYISGLFIYVSFEPKSAKTTANTAAVVVDTIEIKIVSHKSRSTLPRFDSVDCENHMLLAIHDIAAGIDMIPSI